ncbi:MAG: 16S rRNA (uracil(1498)-N(3))-methyltransferase [Prevotella sp.]|nr:16S rRNA (uracil(1498)-N(3))-methyltransferase [Prevotella sp.]MBO5204853.1 16S rRNA (uracil(1498)-N(3))-methyltransferase [Prevotella sp.]
MKETRFFYVPGAGSTTELPDDEAQHVARVLRMQSGDELMLMDGDGSFFRAALTMVSNHHCCYEILEHLPQQRQWLRRMHLAIAPTKLIDRMEWMVEKATEVGFDELTFLNCKFSERSVIKLPRMERIVVSAVKQSHKAWMPRLNDMTAFRQFIDAARGGAKYIAHCYGEVDRTYLFDEISHLPADEDITVLIGPEGDFSIDEVKYAVAAGYKSVHLGDSRLRTETAGLYAVMMCRV